MIQTNSEKDAKSYREQNDEIWIGNVGIKHCEQKPENQKYLEKLFGGKKIGNEETTEKYKNYLGKSQ